MRRRERADIVVWLGLLIVAAVTLSWLRPPTLSLNALGVHPGAPGAWLPALVAMAVGTGVLLARGWLDRAPWPALQIAAFAASAGWAMALVMLRHPDLGDEYGGTFIADTFSGPVARLADGSPWLAGLLIGALFGLAVVLLNAAVQSLSGAVQARRLVPVLVLSPAAAVAADNLQVFSLVAVTAVLAMSAMASERGRGLRWSTSFGLLSGVLLFAGALAGFAGTAVGVGMLCIYFLRRRSLMIVLAAAGLVASLLAAAGLGWSWPDEFGAASAIRLANPQTLAAGGVLAVVVAGAVGGPVLRESWRKLRGTPSWPIMLTGLIAAVVAVLTRPASLGVLPATLLWLPLIAVAASAPPRPAAAPEGPAPSNVAISAVCAVIAALAG